MIRADQIQNFIRLQKKSLSGGRFHLSRRKAIHLSLTNPGLVHHNQRQLHSRMSQVNQHILSINVIHVAIIGIIPVSWPGSRQRKPVTAVLKTRLSFHHLGPHSERVLTAKVRSEFIIGNSLPSLFRSPRRMIAAVVLHRVILLFSRPHLSVLLFILLLIIRRLRFLSLGLFLLSGRLRLSRLILLPWRFCLILLRLFLLLRFCFIMSLLSRHHSAGTQKQSQ